MHAVATWEQRLFGKCFFISYSKLSGIVQEAFS